MDRRPVLYRKYEQVELENLEARQSPMAYDWSKDEYEGLFLKFIHSVISEEVVIYMLIENADGTIIDCPIDKCRFVVDL
jgi:hypothetical protein